MAEKPGKANMTDGKTQPAEHVTTFESIVMEFSERVFNLSLRILHNREDAEEATQDTFMRIFNSINSFKGDSSLSTWIYRIAANVCFDKRKKKRNDKLSFDEMEIDPPDGGIDNRSHQENSLYGRETSEEIDRCIASLPPNESAIITLYYLEGFSYEEISAVLKMPAGTVAVRLHRGRKRLAEMLRKHKDDL